MANVVAESSQTPSWAVSQRTELRPIISPLPIHLSFLKLSAGCHGSLPPAAPLSQPPTHTFTYSPHKHTPTDTHAALMKWILLYQQRTGHLAQWTAMNNSARRGDGKDRRGKVEMGGGVDPETRGNHRMGEVGACQDVSCRGGETQEMNNHDRTCWVNSERGASECFWQYRGPFVLPCADACEQTHWDDRAVPDSATSPFAPSLCSTLLCFTCNHQLK